MLYYWGKLGYARAYDSTLDAIYTMAGNMGWQAPCQAHNSYKDRQPKCYHLSMRTDTPASGDIWCGKSTPTPHVSSQSRVTSHTCAQEIMNIKLVRQSRHTGHTRIATYVSDLNLCYGYTKLICKYWYTSTQIFGIKTAYDTSASMWPMYMKFFVCTFSNLKLGLGLCLKFEPWVCA